MRVSQTTRASSVMVYFSSILTWSTGQQDTGGIAAGSPGLSAGVIRRMGTDLCG
jgi:hypothetical protein